ncbi:hypothetical protein [Streptomyces scopuliridis]|uniref:hypothetical protein n=1 Tax=Streptomyces scopuliridis TaxID=452529 RepID=UPI0004C20368|nr:hypothetical protein [Streptomyces scopuliridis]
MKACIAYGAGDLRVDDLPAPHITENEIAVRVVWMASSVHSACMWRIWPRSSPMRVRWVRIWA